MTVGGKVMFSFIVIALIAVLIGIAVLVYSQVKKNRGPKEKAVGITAIDAGSGEIEMDGSSTFSPTAQSSNTTEESGGESGDYDNNNDLALEEEDTAAVAAAAGAGGDQAFTITDSQDEDDGEVSDSEPVIV